MDQVAPRPETAVPVAASVLRSHGLAASLTAFCNLHGNLHESACSQLSAFLLLAPELGARGIKNYNVGVGLEVDVDVEIVGAAFTVTCGNAIGVGGVV